MMICDNDGAGKDFIKQVRDRGLTEAEIHALVRPLPGDGDDLEMFLLRQGFAEEYTQILAERNVRLTKSEGEPGFTDEMAAKLRTDKTGYTLALVEKLRATLADRSRVPQFFATVIHDIIAKAL